MTDQMTYSHQKVPNTTWKGTWMSPEVSKLLGSMGYNLRTNGMYCGYNPLTNLLLTSWDIQVL